MKKEDLKKLIDQIRKYGLTKSFKNPEEFDKWLSKLNTKQIQNFNSLDIDPTEIEFPTSLLINENLLNCDDYNKRIEAMKKLKNGDGCWHLFDSLCSLNFLNSKNYYQDIELISKASTARYALWIIGSDAFINSKYHENDLKLLVETHDTNQENPLDFVVSDALATVAANIDSLKSPYHQKDMELIATAGSECLQMSGSYPENSLNNLAINKVSLSDKYHLENMQILAKNPIASEFLYNIMTNLEIIQGKYYRNEIEALANAKSPLKARAIYCYITNPNSICNIDFSEALYDSGLDFREINLLKRNENIKGNLNPNYLEYLKLLNEIDDRYVMYFESLLTNKYLFNSQYQQEDLNLLLSVTDKDLFFDLYSLMSDKDSINSIHHKEDVQLISKTKNKKIRQLLLSKATNKRSLNSENHRYDMQYIAKLNLDSIEKEHYKTMYYYLFSPGGIEDKEHTDMLEKLYAGEIIERKDIISAHLDKLESKLDSIDIPKNKVLSRIKKFLKKDN